jgi:hypothetical protein
MILFLIAVTSIVFSCNASEDRLQKHLYGTVVKQEVVKQEIVARILNSSGDRQREMVHHTPESYGNPVFNNFAQNSTCFQVGGTPQDFCG